jgi:hypothetical protein
MITQPSTPLLLDGQDQFLIVSIYTIDMEQFFWFSSMIILMSFFISHSIKCQKFFKTSTESIKDHIAMEVFLFQDEATTDTGNDSTINTPVLTTARRRNGGQLLVRSFFAICGAFRDLPIHILL